MAQKHRWWWSGFMDFKRRVYRLSFIVYRIRQISSLSLWGKIMVMVNAKSITLEPSPIGRGSKGYSLLELMLSIAVGSVILAGTYTASVLVAKQYERISAFSQVQEMGIPTLRLISRDIRMAGHTALDETTATSTYSTITTPITITDSGNACCDSISIIYDKDTATRNRYTYSVALRTAATATTPAKYGLFLTVENWDGTAWIASTTTNALVADYIEDLQFVGSDNDASGNPRIVDVFMMFRSSSMLPGNITYSKPSQTQGNHNYNVTDRYHRDEFSATINIKNLR